MSEHHPLAHARGAACVEKRTDILPPGLAGKRSTGVPADEVRELEHPGLFCDLPVHLSFHIREELLFGKGQVVVDVAGDDGPDLGCALDFLYAGQQEIEGDEHLGVRVVELVGQLPLGVQRIVLSSDRPDPEGCVIRDDHLWDVGKKHGDRVALFNPQVFERAGEPVHHAVELAVAYLLAHVYQGHRIGKLPRAPGEHFRHGEMLECQFRRDVGIVMLVPHSLKSHSPSSSVGKKQSPPMYILLYYYIIIIIIGIG